MINDLNVLLCAGRWEEVGVLLLEFAQLLNI